MLINLLGEGLNPDLILTLSEITLMDFIYERTWASAEYKTGNLKFNTKNVFHLRKMQPKLTNVLEALGEMK